MRYRVDAILFDLDGTLIEPGIDFRALNARVLQTCRAAGVDVSCWEQLPALETLERAVGTLGRTDASGAADLAISANRAIIEIELEAAARVVPFPGVPAMLQNLIDSGYRLGIVTRNSRQAVTAFLERWPLPYQVLLTRDDVAHVKPDPRHLEAALRALGADGTTVLMVGDHPMDIAAGKAIGSLTAAVRSDAIDIERLRQAAPDMILERVTDLVSHLEVRVGQCVHGTDSGSEDDRRRG
ncbi:MAG: HAD family hydrolase [Anaerolineae bacterium]